MRKPVLPLESELSELVILQLAGSAELVAQTLAVIVVPTTRKRRL